MISRRTIVRHMLGIVMLALVDPAHAGKGGNGGGGKGNGNGNGNSGNGNGNGGSGNENGHGRSGNGNAGTSSGKGVGPGAAGKAKEKAQGATRSVKPATDLGNVPARTATYRVRHTNGFQETLARGRYVMQDNRGRTIVDRVAKPRDYARLRELSRL